jgi:calcium-independent phospholipase A2-gamma
VCIQDGGVLTNNPSAIALHECRLLWPGENVHCLVSMGNGRYEPTGHKFKPVQVSGVKNKINKFVQSATDTEGEDGRRVKVDCICLGI